jgi:protocadherin Fat 1/2/3
MSVLNRKALFDLAPKIIFDKKNEFFIFSVVVAHDEDQGANSEVRYSFSHDLGDMMNIFAIDSHTGWISTLVKLDKETKMEYKFYVTATDNGTPKHSARTTVIVRLKDYNDSPTTFKKRFYESAVNEDALPGTVVLALDTIDADSDLTTPVDFYIVSGDPSSQFQIRQTGEIYVAKPLDRENVPHYDLQVLVTDGMFTDVTNVSITILDANGEFGWFGIGIGVFLKVREVC